MCYCNMCGRELDIIDKANNFYVSADIGYGSVYDGDRVEFQLCCNCFDKVIKRFSKEFLIPPIIEGKRPFRF